MYLAPGNIPKQTDPSSCGVFACMNACSFIRDERNPLYKSKNVDNIRHWMVHHLINTSSKKKYLKKQDIVIGRRLTEINPDIVNLLDVKRVFPAVTPHLTCLLQLED